MASRRPFARYLSKVLVESGSYIGDGIQQGLDDGFEQIYSFEVAKQLYERCQDRFKNNPKVHLFLCSSTKMMNYISGIEDRITFWLDGHYSYDGHTSYEEKVCPVMEELEAIGKHHRKDHIILIDDVRLFGTSEFAYLTLDDVKKKILEINPAYQISFTSGVSSNDILVASVI